MDGVDLVREFIKSKTGWVTQKHCDDIVEPKEIDNKHPQVAINVWARANGDVVIERVETYFVTRKMNQWTIVSKDVERAIEASVVVKDVLNVSTEYLEKIIRDNILSW